MSVAVIVPWRGGDPDRERAWDWLAGWWVREYPLWPIFEGVPPDGPWCKAAAVEAALPLVRADVLVIADADVYVPAVGRAAQMVQAGAVAWAMPHTRVYRLSPEGTDFLTTTGVPPAPARVDRPRGSAPTRPGQLIVESHKGEIGGGCVVLPTDLYRRVPLDPRFAGWGQEDTSWGRALRVMAGPPWRESDPLWHLWHPPQPRLKRAIGSQAGLELYRRYRAAATPAAMLALLAEFRPDPTS